ncbi:hypothetical protein [Sporosarcina sp. ITBMC105]
MYIRETKHLKTQEEYEKLLAWVKERGGKVVRTANFADSISVQYEVKEHQE